MMNTRPENWPALLWAFVQGRQSRPFAWGDHDCCLFGADWVRELHPGAVRVLLDERDDILAKALRQCTGKVVGVVGLAHVDGIERRWADANGEARGQLRGGDGG
jgi:hypothetical protein